MRRRWPRQSAFTWKESSELSVPGSFKSGTLLGPFIGICKTKLGLSDEILSEDKIQELSDIVEYANQFHHDTSLSYINSRELLTYVEELWNLLRLARQ